MSGFAEMSPAMIEASKLSLQDQRDLIWNELKISSDKSVMSQSDVPQKAEEAMQKRLARNQGMPFYKGGVDHTVRQQ